MYQAKNMGGNRYHFYANDMHRLILRRTTLERELREALEREEFRLYYQPRYDFQGAKLVGVEALLRWTQPRRGMVSPAEFIPAAEETGLILPLGRWVLHQACSQLAAWARQPALAHLTLAVNVSPRQFHQTGFVPQVLAANFDRVILAQPLAEVNLRRLERELVLAYETGAAVTVVLASEGYPEAPVTGRVIDGLDAAASVDGVHLAHMQTIYSKNIYLVFLQL